MFNGEIYNYKEVREVLIKTSSEIFSTKSDTELLLKAWAAWGQDCLKKFTGMFAFVVYDTRLRNLTSVRDAF